MLVASTPLDARKRKRTFECPTPGISPIRRIGMQDGKRRGLPKLPTGTTLEVLRCERQRASRGPPSKKLSLAENLNMGNLPMSTIEAQTKKSLAYLNGIIALPPPSVLPKTTYIPVKQRRKTVNAQTHRPSQAASDGLNSILMSVDQNSKKNLSHFPELVVISDSDEEAERTVRLRTRKSVAARRKTTVVSNAASDVPNMKDFANLVSNPVAGSRNSMYSSGTSMKLLPVSTQYGGTTLNAPANGRNIPDHTTIIKSEPKDIETTHSLRSHRASAIVKSEKTGAIVKSEKLPRVPQNGSQRGVNAGAYEFDSESLRQSEPEIAKFAMTDIQSWKEMKEQTGVFFSKAPAPHSSGSDGDAFPARAGYLKMEAKKILDIQTCANNVVFTVVKGKGRVKNKTELKGPNVKTDMIVGDILTVPQGSTFNFTNLGTKNDLVMSYVKLS